MLALVAAFERCTARSKASAGPPAEAEEIHTAATSSTPTVRAVIASTVDAISLHPAPRAPSEVAVGHRAAGECGELRVAERGVEELGPGVERAEEVDDVVHALREL